MEVFIDVAYFGIADSFLNTILDKYLAPTESSRNNDMKQYGLNL